MKFFFNRNWCSIFCTCNAICSFSFNIVCLFSIWGWKMKIAKEIRVSQLFLEELLAIICYGTICMTICMQCVIFIFSLFPTAPLLFFVIPTFIILIMFIEVWLCLLFIYEGFDIEKFPIWVNPLKRRMISSSDDFLFPCVLMAWFIYCLMVNYEYIKDMKWISL